jgi:cytidyltransferase-like protein
MIIYIDGIFDLFHYGHIESFRKCKELYPNVHLIVGIISDKVAKSYKRKPIYPEKHRYALVENSKYVDQIIKDPPLIMNKAFMDKYSIDLIVHGFMNENDENKQDYFFEYPKSIGKFETIEYCKEISTTEIIKKCSENK